MQYSTCKLEWTDTYKIFENSFACLVSVRLHQTIEKERALTLSVVICLQRCPSIWASSLDACFNIWYIQLLIETAPWAYAVKKMIEWEFLLIHNHTFLGITHSCKCLCPWNPHRCLLFSFTKQVDSTLFYSFLQL